MFGDLALDHRVHARAYATARETSQSIDHRGSAVVREVMYACSSARFGCGIGQSTRRGRF
jgi:hypothetical protein